jgi:hypothetical protein
MDVICDPYLGYREWEWSVPLDVHATRSNGAYTRLRFERVPLA